LDNDVIFEEKRKIFGKKFGGYKKKTYLCPKFNNCMITKRFKIITLSVIGAFVLSVPMKSLASSWELAAQEQIDDQIKIEVVGKTLTVSGAQGETLEVVSLTGKKVLDEKIETPSQQFKLNFTRGCYIVKVGKVVRKITVG